MKRLLLAASLLVLPSIASAQQAETIEYYQADLVGSIRIVYDVNGNVIGRQDYTPFGTPVLNGTSMPSEGFGGNEKDSETQQMYFHARSLMARTGRFSSPDAVFDALFEPQKWNRYSYVRNNPLTLIDPDGLDDCPPGYPPGTFCSSNNPVPGCPNCEPQPPSDPSDPSLPPGTEPPGSDPGDGCDPVPVGQARTADCGGQSTGTGSGNNNNNSNNNNNNNSNNDNNDNNDNNNHNHRQPPGPPNREQQCKSAWIAGNYGNLVDKYIVPEFSMISLVTNFKSFVSGSEITLGLKAGLLGAGAYGKVLTTTGKNLAAYPGQAAAAADAMERGLLWSNSAAGAAEFLGWAGAGLTTYATGVDIVARFECR